MFRLTQESIFSNPMAESAQFDNVLSLGKLLVEELGLDKSVDTLGRWMAHYIAELIRSAESASEEDRYEKRSQCASAIIELWAHHTVMPKESRPFRDFEPILRALDSLDPDKVASRYYESIREKAAKDEKNTESAAWLETADGVDYTARLLIRFCLACAARDVVDKSKEWVVLAEAAGAADDGYRKIVRIVSHEAELTDDEATPDEDRKEIENRIKRLDSFSNLAKLLSGRLKAKLCVIDNESEGTETRHPIAP